jgi:hypothetical protein
MFSVYQKITSPDTSPLLGPAKSPDVKPTDPVTPLSLSLCDCCSQRSKDINANANANAITKSTESEYEFNHATHYTCNKTTPRLVWYEFYDTCN